MDKAIFKLNGGRGALLCNECHTIIAEGHGHDLSKKHFCTICRINQIFKQLPYV